jgi:hypothetical protein
VIRNTVLYLCSSGLSSRTDAMRPLIFRVESVRWWRAVQIKLANPRAHRIPHLASTEPTSCLTKILHTKERENTYLFTAHRYTPGQPEVPIWRSMLPSVRPWRGDLPIRTRSGRVRDA